MIFVSIWFVQYWMIEENWRRFTALVSAFLLLFVGTALFFPHSNKRIASYVSGFFSQDAQTESSSLSWTQSERALTLFESGGMTGESSRDILSSFLPEQHTDFAFAVASRSFGILFTLSVIGLLCLLAWAVYKDLRKHADPLVILAVSGGLFQIIVQSVLHMSSNLSLIPTVGSDVSVYERRWVFERGQRADAWIYVSLVTLARLVDMEQTVVLAAGGSGGHMSPAVSSYEFLSRTYSVVVLTDSKGRQFLDKVAPQVPSYLIQAQSPSVKATAVWSLGIGLWQSLRRLRKLGPQVIVGFGGYATVPVLIAGFLLRVPLIIHEQNRCLGRANRLLKPIATHLALGFDIGDQSPKTRVTGNPTCFSPCQYCPPEDAIEIVVSGGSQGATRLSSTVPKAIALLSTEIKQRLSVSHQAREEDVQAVREAYRSVERRV